MSHPKTGIALQPPPPPPPPSSVKAPTSLVSKPPVVALTGPIGAFMVELLIFNGSPFKDHWAYWVRSHSDPDIGVKMHATGDVANGFVFEVNRYHDLRTTSNKPTIRIPLQWVDGKFFDEEAMLNHRQCKDDTLPVCGFEASAHKVKAPGKTLNTVSDGVKPGEKIVQRNCQTWIIESADQLLKDKIFNEDVVVYLRAIEQ